ncbi:MAG: hypothetical protein WA691_04880 [Thermoplasmata archaeon]
MIVVDGRLVSPSAYRPSSIVDLEDTVAWWSSLAILGALLFVAGLLVGAGEGETVTLVGVALFFGTAVLAGAERTEPATALGVAGLVWTASGISLVLGTDPSLFGSLVGLAAAGGIVAVTGALGAVRARARGATAARLTAKP